MDATEATPLMRQYREIKGQHPDAILFFRVGDFYEMFFEDAVEAAGILKIALTSRDKNKENGVPLCGVPYHAAAGYIQKLIVAGRSVALCEQMEAAGAVKGKGTLRREVTRVITPGTVIEATLLSAGEPNHIAALWPPSSGPTVGLAFLDLSTGDFRMATLPHVGEIEAALAILAPKEILLPEGHSEFLPQEAAVRYPIRLVSAALFVPARAHALLRSHFGVHSVLALGEEGAPDLVAAGGLLGHVHATQKGALGSITALRPHPHGTQMRLSSRTIDHLDLLPNGRHRAEGALLPLLDQTITPMGSRLLREWVLHPLVVPEMILERQEAVAAFYDRPSERMHLRAALGEVSDMARLIGRISLAAAPPPDLIALARSLSALPAIEKIVSGLPVLGGFPDGWDTLADVATQIGAALVVPPPLSLKEGGVIREGYLPPLDELRRFQQEGRTTLTRIESSERQRTGIESLKIRYNQVFGYYIEVSEAQIKKIPADYVRKQTLTRAERFTTTALRDVEEKMRGAEETTRAMEVEAYDALCGAVARHTARIQKMARVVARLDVFSTLAEVAHRNTYTRPRVSAGRTIRIVDGRHPVLERTETRFVPNDTTLDPPARQMLILTGPNMAGKSTYMKQTALIVLMAQIGSFVPARESDVGVVDRIFTRVGAEDDIARGMSTFMVEMTEMGQILRQATSESLLLLDEIGRGTSTFDGMSIAQAICEAVHRIGARTLFATHYHELTRLGEMEGVHNCHARVHEANGEVVFLRKIGEGGADRSYGIHVARLAGLPASVIERAGVILKEMEAGAALRASAWVAPRATDDGCAGQVIRSTPHPALDALRALDPLHLTPMQALQKLTDLIAAAKSPADGDTLRAATNV